jgi:hypothetical protein
VRANHTYDYAIVRVVPRVERGEFVNAGVILSCAPERYLKAIVHIYEEKILTLDPNADLESIRATVNAIPLICEGGPQAGELGKLSRGERFHWLIAPRSSSVQTSVIHSGRCSDLDAALKKIFEKMV